MSKIDKAVEWAVKIAEDDSHGYDQDNRWGPDYDCSSFVITAWENAGVPVKSNGASNTSNMVSVFKSTGFKDITSSITLSTGAGLQKGDIVWKSGHTEMVYNSSYGLVGASINENGGTTGGVTGDQTEKEIRTRSYYNYPWTTVLRYTGDNGSEDDEIDKSDCISEDRYLTTAEMTINAKYIYSYFIKKGWSVQAISALLGNMQAESTINPGLKERPLSSWSADKKGYGLTQWTPATKIIQYLESNGFANDDIEGQCQRIEYEFNNGVQYYPSSTYSMTAKEFKVSTNTPYYLASVFAWNYERSSVVLYGSEAEKEALRKKRGGYADYWYNVLKGYSPTPSTRKRKKFNFILFNQRRRNTAIWINRNYHRR